MFLPNEIIQIYFFYKTHTEGGNHDYDNCNPSMKILFDSSFSKNIITMPFLKSTVHRRIKNYIYLCSVSTMYAMSDMNSAIQVNIFGINGALNSG